MLKIATNICFILFLVLCLLIHTSLSANHLTNFQITETQITNTSSDHSIQDVDGSKILWIGEGNEGEGLYIYDLATEITTNLYNGFEKVILGSLKNDQVGAVFKSEGDIQSIGRSGCGQGGNWTKVFDTELANVICTIEVEGLLESSKFLFLEKGNINGVYNNRIMCWTSNSGITTICDFSSNKLGLAVYNSYIFWSDDRSGDYDIWAYDFNSGLTFAFVSAPGDQFLSYCQDFQTIFGNNFVVWKDGRNCTSENPDNYDIYGKNMISGDIFIVAESDKEETNPVVYGNRVAWIEKERLVDENDYTIGWNDIIKSKDLSTGIVSEFLNSSTYKRNLLMSNDYIVWSESSLPHFDSSSFDLKGYSISFNTPFIISEAEGDQFCKYIDGNTVLWEDSRNNNIGICNIFSGVITYQ
ncbi:hypothetical protein LLG10_08290 [bacterium]|nr:hypothetical protein [bacterium]